MKRLVVPILASLGAIGFVGTLWLIFTWAPIDPELHFNQKIFYWHVSHAFMMFMAVALCGICSLVFLKKRDPKWDDVALAAAEVAVAFGLVVLLTGSIWAKAAWDIWWTWEKRLTMSLLLWLTLVGYLLVRKYAGASGERISAGMAVFAMIGVPFIYTMVGSGDNHPKAGGGGNVATLSGPILKVFWLSVVTFFLWFMALVLNRIQSARLDREVRTLREKALDAGVLE